MRGEIDFTSLEVKVKGILEDLGIDFVPQLATRTGYILDYAIPSKGVAIEVDGPHHDKPRAKRRDYLRDKQLRREGWRVIRLSHKDLDDPQAVREKLRRELI
jgi:very-short-patch-repair endonuclease